MRLLFILENYHPHVGGVEVVFRNLCEGLAKRHDVTVLTRRLPGSRKKEKLNGVKIQRVSSLDSRYVLTLSAIPEAIRLAKRADLIHTTTYNAVLPAWLASVITGKPSVITVHETWIGNWKRYSDFSPFMADLHDTMEKLLYLITSFNAYICVSDSTRKMLTGAMPKVKGRIHTIHNGFDATFWKKKRTTGKLRKKLGLEGKYVVFAAGRPGTSKGFQHLLKSYKIVKKSMPDVEYVIVLAGGSQYDHRRDEWENKYPEINFLGQQNREQLAALRQMADCVVVPSLAEGFGYAVLESVASGTPLVATDTTSIPEVVGGKHLLVKPASPKALADGIIKSSKGKYKRTKMKSFPWSRNITKHEKLYGDLT